MVVPLWGASIGEVRWMQMARPGAYLVFGLLALSFYCLVHSFVINDFTVSYVATHSNSFLPTAYRIAAVWGGHEGSLLLWVLTLGGWMAAVAHFSRGLPLDIIARVISVMNGIAVGFMLFTLLTSNPFERMLPNFPLDGKDLNPLLQDFGLIVHPPMLYMGYVGFAVAYAFAVAGLLSGKLDSAWARWSRPWTTVAWCFLTLGIALGSWWAYYELGWGGWWFWDPVENASFMPWLVGTALMHSLAVSEKRGVFKAWTVLLALTAFSLSLLGTFLVRSGVLTSVHAFASDPERGAFILAFLGVVAGGSLILFALRATVFDAEKTYGPLSREMFLLVNNIFFVGATAVVLLGTLFPLISEMAGFGKISVGPPYFNMLFVPLCFAMMLALGIGVLVRWKRHDAGQLWQQIRWWAASSVFLGIVLPFVFFTEVTWGVVGAAMFSLWVLAVLYIDLKNKVNPQRAGWWKGLRRQTPSYMGMVAGHLGLVILVLGIAGTSQYSVEKDVRMGSGDKVDIGPYTFHFENIRQVEGPNYSATRGTFLITEKGDLPQDGKILYTLTPEKRRYWASGDVMTEASIEPGLSRDIYVALGEPIDDADTNGDWAVRVYFKPVVRLIWLGAIFMALGGFLAISDKRYRMAKSQASASASKQVTDSAGGAVIEGATS
jgi:cytochrome c-type biogenesis protein CcmF